jgi:DNA-binding IclR family transcriptional regulator
MAARRGSDLSGIPERRILILACSLTSGAALVAAAEPELRALATATGLPKVGPHTITDQATLWREVEQARRRG